MSLHPITGKHIEKSYQLLALLSVAAHASREIDFVERDACVNFSAEVAMCLDLAHEMAGELHDLLERNRQKGGDNG